MIFAIFIFFYVLKMIIINNNLVFRVFMFFHFFFIEGLVKSTIMSVYLQPIDKIIQL
ncbi:hypothetical protein CLU83_4596 [Flavobacterium sp. 1]|nr:hypothetical protein CLU83_4596 [Flavobacterium sp. 1]